MLCVLWLWKAVWWLVLECMLMCMGSGLVVGRVYSWAPVGCVRLHAVHFKELSKYTREIGLTSYMKLDMYTELLSLVLVFWNSSIQHRHHKHQVEVTKHQSFHLINLNSYMDYILLTCCTLQRAIRTHTGEISFTNYLLLHVSIHTKLLLSCDHTASSVVRHVTYNWCVCLCTFGQNLGILVKKYDIWDLKILSFFFFYITFHECNSVFCWCMSLERNLTGIL